MGYQKRRLYQALDNLPASLKPESQREILLALQGYFETTEAGFESANVGCAYSCRRSVICVFL